MGFHEQFNLVKVEVIIQVDLWISFLNREIRNDVYGELQIQKKWVLFVLFITQNL